MEPTTTSTEAVAAAARMVYLGEQDTAGQERDVPSAVLADAD